MGFESKASLLDVKRLGAWLRLPTFAEELATELAKAAAIRANPFYGIAPLRFRTVRNQHYKAPLVTLASKKRRRPKVALDSTNVVR